MNIHISKYYKWLVIGIAGLCFSVYVSNSSNWGSPNATAILSIVGIFVFAFLVLVMAINIIEADLKD